ncbi:MAG: hemolysin family protein [Pirellulaceae bacterium]|nr:HlyC/CorC family transporter [Planctomycetales bacterium]
MLGSFYDAFYLLGALLLVILNGFFVAAEFALVKVRGSQLDELVVQGRPMAKTAQWLGQRMDASLSACQLGVTMASLGLGWLGEPAFARLVEPLLHLMGVDSPTAVHTIGFIISFTLISGLHLVIGEQAPKIFAIRRPEQMALWCAGPLLFFYVIFYPFLIALNWATAIVLGAVGMKDAAGHGSPLTEAEFRVLLQEAHLSGEVTGSEHRLINAVFEFDDMICRRVMVPRVEVESIDLEDTLDECIELARRTKHTRFPVCDGSLDDIVGIFHIKDLVGIDRSQVFDVRSIMRPPRQVPETMPISRLLRHFQATHQLMAVVVDEYGTVVGIVTLENVLEQIVGPVEDEFDSEPKEIVPTASNQFLVRGTIALDRLATKLELDLEHELEEYPEVDTLSGLIVAKLGRLVTSGDEVTIGGAQAEVLEVRAARALQVRITKSS